MSIINPIKIMGESLSGVINSLNGIITSKDERMKNDNQLGEIRNELADIQKDIYSKAADVEMELIKAKSSALTSEINGNNLQRSWRPILMLCFGGIIIYQYFLVHLVNVIFTAFSIEYQGALLYIPEFDLPDRFWTLLEIGVGGYIAGRSLEKITPNVAKTIMDSRESRRMTEEMKMKQDVRQDRREYNQDRRDRRQEREEELLDDMATIDNSGDNLSAKQQRQKKRLERKLRGKEKIKNLFYS